MATRQVSTRNLVGLTSLSFIRPQTVTFSVKNTKPNTRLYAFFDGISVDGFVVPTGGSFGGDLVTNASGTLSGSFSIPAMTFNTGDREFKLQDSPTYDSSAIPGSTVGSATAKFTAVGMLETYQTTIDTVTTIEIFSAQESGGDGGSSDPLAQTFFTYGVTGGCHITAIDLYFQTKDTALPVTLELRETANGYPSSTRVSKQSSVTLMPSQVSVSANASLATRFTFSRPIYLEENKDYCFVLLANTNAYHVWTSKLGEKSIETGATIFEQPFIGSMFKSENNITWTAEQTEDIKFTLYKAKFSATSADITFKANAPRGLLYGSYMSVTAGSPVVTLSLPFEHAHNTGENIYFYQGTTGGVYRGISDTVMTDADGFSATVIDEKTLTFSVGVNATSTGTLAASGGLDSVAVDYPGSGYVSPTITFSGGGGTGAAATAVLSSGKVVSVTVTSRGTGYTSSPTVSITDSSGSGATLVAISESIFMTAINRPFQNLQPVFYYDSAASTSVDVSARLTNESYVVGTHENVVLNTGNDMNKLGVLVTPEVETTSFGATDSTQVIVRLKTDNTNISPLIDLSNGAWLKTRNFLINSQSNIGSETSNSSGSAKARYISKPVTVETLSKDIRVLVNAASVAETSFAVFVRVSNSGATVNHTDGSWIQLTCTSLTNLSSTITEYKDYEFVTSNYLSPFDVYDIKIVLTSENKYLYPRINDYRAIVLAT
jgi:hypothetical protein